MSTVNGQKKSAVDWHRADIIAALHKAGWSLRQLAFFHGYKSGTALKNALDKPYPKGERIIADAIGIPANVVFAGRFAYRQGKKTARRTEILTPQA